MALPKSADECVDVIARLAAERERVIKYMPGHEAAINRLSLEIERFARLRDWLRKKEQKEWNRCDS